jgi:hypothetical protein
VLLSPDGRKSYEASGSGDAVDAAAIGREAGANSAGALPQHSLPNRDRLMRLIVTRPEPDATRTGKALMALGHVAILSPMIDVIANTSAPLPERPFQAVLVTSANAVR